MERRGALGWATDVPVEIHETSVIRGTLTEEGDGWLGATVDRAPQVGRLCTLRLSHPSGHCSLFLWAKVEWCWRVRPGRAQVGFTIAEGSRANAEDWSTLVRLLRAAVPVGAVSVGR